MVDGRATNLFDGRANAHPCPTLATPLTFSPQMDYWSSSTQSYCISFGTGRSGFCYNFLSTLKPGVDDCNGHGIVGVVHCSELVLYFTENLRTSSIPNQFEVHERAMEVASVFHLSCCFVFVLLY